MSLLSYKLTETGIILRVKILDSSSSLGLGLTGLVFGSTGLTVATIADNEAATTAYLSATSLIEDITTLGTYAAPTATKCRFKEVDAQDHRGVYEIHIADARFAVSGAKYLLVSIRGATDAAECDALIPLVTNDPYKDVHAGITLLSEWLGIIAGKQVGDATALTEIAATGAGSGTYDEATDSLEALSDGGISSVVVGPLTSAQTPGNIIGTPTPLEQFDHAAHTHLITVNDADGDPISLTGKTLKFVCETRASTPVLVFSVDTVTGPRITVTGASNEIANVQILPADYADDGPGSYNWRLWDTTTAGSEALLLFGTFEIVQTLSPA